MLPIRIQPLHLAALALAALPALVPAQTPAASVDAAQRQKALQAAGLRAPLTLLPVRVLDRPDARVAEVLALVLERQGMADLDVAGAAFAPPAGTSWEGLPPLLKAHVQQAARAATPRHWLYAEYLGEPRSGPKEVRFVLLDAAGELVLNDRQTQADADFKTTAGRDPDPLGCSTLVAERLFGLAGWKKAPGTVRDGKFAKQWREKSGAPDPVELAAMEKRRAALRDRLSQARIAVLPTLGLAKHDAASTQRLAGLVGSELGCRATAAPDGAKLEVAPGSNEQKRLWDLAAALRATLRQQAADADYALVADIGLDPEGGRGFVHVVVCTAAGELVLADLQNDQHPMFQASAPKTLADAERLAVARLARLLR